MHLLNNPSVSSSDSSSTYHPPPDLPPIQSFSSFAKASNYSLPPLEPDAGNHHGGSNTGEKPTAKPVHQIPPLASITEEYNAGRYHEGTGAVASSSSGSSRQPSGGISLRMLFDPEVNESTHSLTHILDDVPESSSSTAAASSEDVSNKKRHRAMTVKDDIMHLPQPLKKQKSSQNIMSGQNIMPPIIIGLYEPPPNAAVFPPIALDDGNEVVAATSLNTLKDYTNSNVNSSNHVDVQDTAEKVAQAVHAQERPSAALDSERPLQKVKRKAAKPRKKWSEEETRHLLLGVNKHGVGKWTSILEDREYKFNGRTAGDLKDRFRTCCPDELRVVPSKSKESLRQQDHAAHTPPPPESRSKGKGKTGLLLEYILADPEEIPGNQSTEDLSTASMSQAGSSQQDADPLAKPKKSRAHRKKIEDLQAMGIHGPFKKSHRRERRPFTQQDDDQILEGLQLYGPAWTKIQRDPRFNLSSRQPTDLRDRVRNKYPEMYKQIEEKQLHHKDSSSALQGPPTPTPQRPGLRPSRSNNVLEPSVNAMLNENSYMTLEPHLNRAGMRQEDSMVPKWNGGPSSTLPAANGIMNNGGGGGGGGGGGSSFQELPGMDSFARDPTLEEVDGVGEQSGSAAFIGMMDISRLLLD